MTTSTTTTPLPMVLQADDPDAWLATHLAARFHDWEAEAPPATEPAIVSVHDVLADDAAFLHDAHDRLVAGGTPPQAAATYLAGYHGGMVAGAVGYGLAAAGAGFLIDDPVAVRCHVHPAGWIARVELPARVVVDRNHPWSRLDGVDIVESPTQVVARSVASLVDLTTPIVDACHRLTRVGRAGLWNEVGDALATAVAFQDRVAVTPAMLSVLHAAVRTEGVPWRARPTLELVDLGDGNMLHVIQKGGCCLAYTEDHIVPDPDDPDLDEMRREYLRRFPLQPDKPQYCTTCSFRTFDDTLARQRFRAELLRRR